MNVFYSNYLFNNAFLKYTQTSFLIQFYICFALRLFFIKFKLFEVVLAHNLWTKT